MLRKRLNLKEKLGSMIKRVNDDETGEQGGDSDVATSGQELKIEAAADSNLGSAWLEGEKEIFELQLGQLEEQLTASWMKNEKLAEELEELRGHDVVRKYKEEKRASKNLKKRVTELEGQLSALEKRTVPEPLDSWETVEKEDSLEVEANQVESQLQQASALDSTDRCDQEEDVLSTSSEPEAPVSWRGRLMGWCADRMIDFTDEQLEPEPTVVYNHPLTYKRLKKSLKRFGKDAKLSLRAVTWIASVVSWKNPFQTFTVFVVYMYAAWLDCLFPLLFLLCIGKLVVNYFYATGLAMQFGFQMEQPVEEEVTESKMQLILTVARHVQNISAQAADNMEKIKNLFLWHEPKATKKLMTILLWAFLLTALFPFRLVFKLVAIGAGVRIFIIGPIYRAFPKVERRYGSISRLYKSLPTDELLQNYYELSETERDARSRRVVSSTSDNTRRESASSAVSPADSDFCQRFVIDPPEPRIKPLDVGVGCQLIDRGQSVFHMLRSGKLYLTPSFLVFERLFRKYKQRLKQEDYVLIPLQDVTSVKKCKPFVFLPGKGMAIEVIVGEQQNPYVFGALMSREEVYQTILQTGVAAGLRWGNVETQ